MGMKKLNTLAEKFIALGNGYGIRKDTWPPGVYIEIIDDVLVNENGFSYNLESVTICNEIYEAPKDENLYEWRYLNDRTWWNAGMLMTKQEAQSMYTNVPGIQDYAIKSGPFNPKEFKKE